MSRALTVLGLLCLLPYAYMVYFWGFCEDCVPTGHSWVYSLILFAALPIVIAAYAIISSLSAARALQDSVAERKPTQSVLRAGLLWLAVIIAVPAIFASFQIYKILFPEVEEGRDRLGRICQESPTGGSQICRPDPEAERETLYEQLNRRRRQQD